MALQALGPIAEEQLLAAHFLLRERDLAGHGLDVAAVGGNQRALEGRDGLVDVFPAGGIGLVDEDRLEMLHIAGIGLNARQHFLAIAIVDAQLERVGAEDGRAHLGAPACARQASSSSAWC